MGTHRRPYHPTGLYAAPPPTLPDRSTPIGQVLCARRDALVADLGGVGSCSTSQLALVDLAIRSWAILDSVDAYLLSLPSPINKRHHRTWQVVQDRARLASQLEATLCKLGLERRSAPVESFESFVARRLADKEAAE